MFSTITVSASVVFAFLGLHPSVFSIPYLFCISFASALPPSFLTCPHYLPLSFSFFSSSHIYLSFPGPSFPSFDLLRLIPFPSFSLFRSVSRFPLLHSLSPIYIFILFIHPALSPSFHHCFNSVLYSPFLPFLYSVLSPFPFSSIFYPVIHSCTVI